MKYPFFQKQSKVIYVCGTHSTGKSTVLNEVEKVLKKKGKTTWRNPSPREVIPNGLFYNEVDDLTQFHITFGILSRFLNLKVDYVLLDRFLVDNIVYSQTSLKISPELHNIQFNFLHYMYNNFQIKTFYIPIEIPLERDGFRSEDNSLRESVDLDIKQVLKQFNIKYITLKGSVEKRTKLLLKNI